MTEERRLVTVIFADAVGSTGLGERLDPEDVRSLMSRYFAIARDVVEIREGTVEKFIGDAVMAVFGLPRAHGDDAARALDAAIELRDRVRADPQLGERLPIRIGVNTGEVVAGPAGPGDGNGRDRAGDTLITGDAVNVAARLEQGAEAWTIVCGERTVRAAGDQFVFGQLDPVDARGHTAAVGAAVLEGRAPASARVAAHTRIVGRDDDLDQLDLVARRAFRESRPYLVSILAPAGTGKSRLLEEFLDRLKVQFPDTDVATAQCLPYGQRLTYWPMRALLLDLLDLPTDTGPARIREATLAWLIRLDDQEAGADAELLSATVGAGAEDATDRTAVFNAWRRAIELAALRHPLVLVVEDLHWSSDSLLDLIETVLTPRADAPLLMVALSRPELLDRRPSWGGGRGNRVTLALEPLDEAALSTLVGDLLENPAPEIVRTVVARSDGNPFFAGELVRSIVERSGDLSDPAAVERAMAALPDTVQATVLARLDDLPFAERRVLQVGSVFGRTFRAAGLEALEPDRREELVHVLESLGWRDLVRPEGPDGLAFRHILIREVAYGTLPRAERARLHSAAGAWLESIAGDNAEALAELIGYHYREAVVLGRAAGAQLDPDLRPRAVQWLLRARESAIAAAAQLEGARHVQAAIDLAEPDELPELYELLGDTLLGGPEPLEAYRTALDLARERGRPADVELRILSAQLLLLTRWQGSVGTEPLRDVPALVDQGHALLPDVADDRIRALFLIGEAFQGWATVRTHDGAPVRVDRQVEAAREALEVARRLDDVPLQSAALDATSTFDLINDDYRRSLAIARERLELGSRLDFIERLDARTMIAWHETILGDLADSVEFATETLAALSPGQAPTFGLSSNGWLITCLHVLGRWDEAIAAATRMSRIWDDLGRPPAGYAIHGFLSALDIGRARRDETLEEQYRGAVDHILAEFTAGDRIGRLKTWVRLDLDAIVEEIIGRFHETAGRIDHLDRAIAACSDRRHRVDPALLQRLLAYVDPRGIRLIGAQARRALGLATVDPDELRAALDLFETMAAIPYAARTQIELGELIGDPPLIATGIARLEAVGDLDQLARVADRRLAR